MELTQHKLLSHLWKTGKSHTEQEDSEVDPGKTNKERVTTGHLSFPGTWNTPACSKSPEKRLLKKTRGKEGRRWGGKERGRDGEGGKDGISNYIESCYTQL